jgi:hypothetical protein
MASRGRSLEISVIVVICIIPSVSMSHAKMAHPPADLVIS